MNRVLEQFRLLLFHDKCSTLNLILFDVFGFLMLGYLVLHQICISCDAAMPFTITLHAIYYYQHFGCPNFGNPNVFSQFSITYILGVRISETQIFSTKISIFCDTLAIIYCQDFGCPNFGNPNVFSQFSITHILGVRISETQI